MWGGIGRDGGDWGTNGSCNWEVDDCCFRRQSLKESEGPTIESEVGAAYISLAVAVSAVLRTGVATMA